MAQWRGVELRSPPSWSTAAPLEIKYLSEDKRKYIESCVTTLARGWIFGQYVLHDSRVICMSFSPNLMSHLISSKRLLMAAQCNSVTLSLSGSLTSYPDSTSSLTRSRIPNLRASQGKTHIRLHRKVLFKHKRNYNNPDQTFSFGYYLCLTCFLPENCWITSHH